jgi:glutathione synthase/RimK-type ligase-like ATP-grasp enzyme
LETSELLGGARWVQATGAINRNIESRTTKVPSDAVEVLLISQKFDPHADVVGEALFRRGRSFLRLNTDDVHAYSLTWGSDTALSVSSDGCTASFEKLRSCFVRPSAPSGADSSAASALTQKMSATEGLSFVRNLHSIPGPRWVSDPINVERAYSKLAQLRVAQQTGFRVPRTLVTNNPDDAKIFASSVGGDIVVKRLGHEAIEDEFGFLETTATRYSQKQFLSLTRHVRLGPSLIQEYIPKAHEYRVTVVGDECFSVRMQPRNDFITTTDWSMLGMEELVYTPTDLPTSVGQAVFEFVRRFGLCFSALDLLVAPDGGFVFLENNPTGAWHWIERATGLQITESIVNLLTGPDL